VALRNRGDELDCELIENDDNGELDNAELAHVIGGAVMALVARGGLAVGDTITIEEAR
jgi:bacteriocin-like protein